ncbi:serine/threonine-protein kinase [Streptomyces sp. NPDC004065]|uniref:serine/threonine-protein kinase n=1 Tax=Streptomyces sp. NPDC004065 TaxID=3364689 RepID=UPI00384D031C
MTPQRNTGAGAEAELPEYAGHYRLESCLGSGGMGVVHLARSTSGMKLAVKVVHAQFARDPEFRGRFRQEVAAARRVSGAFTAPVVDADPEAERPWMATQFIPGPTLSEQVKRNGSMAPAELRRLMAGLAEALRDIHRVGVVHRDLKPSNVLLAEDGPKVIDFGISRPTDSELRTETGKLIGTPPFMAPEQFRRPREVGPAADVFALGSVLVHAATGRGPFDSDSPYIVAYQVVHDEPDLTGVPGNLAPLVLRCLAKEPEDRPTPDELMRELRSVAASYDTQAFIPEQRVSGTPEGAGWAGSGSGSGGRGRAGGSAGASGHAQPYGPMEPGSHAGPGGLAGADGDAGADGRAGSDGLAESGRSGGPGGLAGAARPGEPTGGDEPAGQEGGSAGQTGGAGVRWPGGGSRGRRLALAAGALVLVVGGSLASVELLDGAGPARGAASGSTLPGATSAAFHGWVAAPVSGGQGVPHCSLGAGKLVCARDGLVYALDPADGRLLWRHAVTRAVRGTPPVVAGGLVQPMLDHGRRLEALDPASGRPRWQRNVPAYRGIRYAGGMLLLSGDDGTVRGVDPASGATRWSRRVPVPGPLNFSAFPGDPLAYAAGTSDDGSATRIVAVDPRTGQVRWEARLRGTLTPVGSRAGSLVLLAAERSSGYGRVDAVVRYDPATRASVRVTLSVPRDSVQAGVHGDVVHLLGAGGSLDAVDLSARAVRWRLETSVSRGSAPVADTRHVYFTAGDGRLLAVDGRTGALAGQTRPRLGAHADRVAASLPTPLVAGGHVYAAAPDGSVFAVDGRDPSGW